MTSPRRQLYSVQCCPGEAHVGGAGPWKEICPTQGISVLATTGVFPWNCDTCLKPRDLNSRWRRETQSWGTNGPLRRPMCFPGLLTDFLPIPRCCAGDVTACSPLSRDSSPCASSLHFTQLRTGSLRAENSAAVPCETLCTWTRVCTGGSYLPFRLSLSKCSEREDFVRAVGRQVLSSFCLAFCLITPLAAIMFPSFCSFFLNIEYLKTATSNRREGYEEPCASFLPA